MPEIFVDPNVVYVGLVISLWIGVTAVYMPGTGFIEALALVAIAASLYALTNMPTNWVAVLVIIVGVLGFLIMPFIRQQYALLALGGLALQGAGGLFLFNDGLSLSPVIIVATLAVPLAYHMLVLVPILRRLTEQATVPVDREDTMIGKRGRVTRTIDPIGTIQADSELWTARSDDVLEAGTEVMVVAREGLQLIVEPYKRKRQPTDHSQNGAIEDIADVVE